MMDKPWNKIPNRTREHAYLSLSVEARGILAGLEMHMASGPLEGNLTHLSTWLSVSRKECRLKTHLDRLMATGYIVGSVEDRGKEGLWYTLDLPENHPERAQEKPKKGARKPREKDENAPTKAQEEPENVPRNGQEKGEDKSPFHAGFGDSSLNKILPSEGEGEEDKEREGERETARAPESAPASPHPSAEPLCNLLADLIHSHGVKKPPVTLHWLDQMELVLIRDKRDPLEVEQMIHFAQGDDFWRGVILEPRKLRDHWDKMWFQQHRAKPEGKTQPSKPATGTTDDAIAGFLAMYEGGNS